MRFALLFLQIKSYASLNARGTSMFAHFRGVVVALTATLCVLVQSTLAPAAQTAGRVVTTSTPNGGATAMIGQWRCTVFFYRTGVRVFVRTANGQPAATTGLQGSITFYHPNSPAPWFRRELRRTPESLDLSMNLSSVPPTARGPRSTSRDLRTRRKTMLASWPPSSSWAGSPVRSPGLAGRHRGPGPPQRDSSPCPIPRSSCSRCSWARAIAEATTSATGPRALKSQAMRFPNRGSM